MNILFFSHLSERIYAGPNFSVPAGVKAQQLFDNCLWVNLTHAYMKHWGQVDAYHNVKDFGGEDFTMENLPSPFDNPDLVVFEGFYFLQEVKIAKSLRRKDIPYIIVPRGSLTNEAMKNQAWLKKRFAHLFYFDRFCKKALTIQYLTEQEYKDSYKKWNNRYIILPNGFDEPEKKKSLYSEEGIKMLFIGRPDKFHKGLDVLWGALIEMKQVLIQNHVTLDFYAPKGKGDYDELAKQVEEYKMQDVIIMHDKIGGKDKEDAILNADLFVLTSRFEGHPMGLVEALAYGLPAFVTPGSNMAKEIQDGDAGWVADCNVDSLKKTLQRIIAERELLQNKGNNALRLAENYRWKNIAKAFHEEMIQLV